MTEHDDHGMLPDDGDVRAALQRVAPELRVPDGMVAGARRRRQRNRGLVAGGAMAVVTAMVVPFALNLGGGSLESSQDSGSVLTAAPAEEAAPAGDNAGDNPPAPAAEVPAASKDGSYDEGSAAEEGVVDLTSAVPSAERAAAASLRLGWSVIQASDEDNRVVSPSSLAMSLAQAAEGAEGASLKSIDAALGLIGDARSESFA
ncbi:MAG: hypothetical protein Q4G35_13420, partial [Propionibacteriaceae bacterium]|nr:hypothetical protein [Propionibacteriaceae bacterium]